MWIANKRMIVGVRQCSACSAKRKKREREKKETSRGYTKTRYNLQANKRNEQLNGDQFDFTRSIRFFPEYLAPEELGLVQTGVGIAPHC
jgi:hypothetical protein